MSKRLSCATVAVPHAMSQSSPLSFGALDERYDERCHAPPLATSSSPRLEPRSPRPRHARPVFRSRSPTATNWRRQNVRALRQTAAQSLSHGWIVLAPTKPAAEPVTKPFLPDPIQQRTPRRRRRATRNIHPPVLSRTRLTRTHDAAQHVPATAQARRRPPARTRARTNTRAAAAQDVQLHRRRHGADRRRQEEHPRWHPQVGVAGRHTPFRAPPQ